MTNNPKLSQRIAAAAAASNVANRALPDVKGGLVPKQLQTYRAEAYSYFTIASNETQLLYSAEMWVKLKLTLETAGPVAVGDKQTLNPVLSGKGRLLDPGVEYEVTLPRGTRWYVTSQTVNRISVTIEPIPWLEQIDQDINANQGLFASLIQASVGTIVAAIDRLRGLGAEPTPHKKPAPPQLPAVAGPTLSQLASRLTLRKGR